jgi:hypothetical protein
MALIVTTLEMAFKTIFNAMNSMSSGGDAYCAAQIASTIKTYILAGQVATVDTGAVPGGVYAGAGVGTMTINSENLKNALQTTFEGQYNNDDLAAHIATDIDNACKADNTISIISTGTVTTPAGITSPFSGPGQGKFTGIKVTIETILKICFAAMNAMASGGNAYFASQFATAVDTYLKAGSVSVTLTVPPFASGSGTGAIV